MLFSKSYKLSKAMHEEKGEEEEGRMERDGGACITLTVWRKSLVFSCNGFTVIDSNGNIVYRVDNYIGGSNEQLILMDGFGKSLLTLSRSKKLGLGESWSVYEGEMSNENEKKIGRKKPICRVRKNRNILHVAPNRKVLAYVYNNNISEKKYAFSVEGSYGNRSCKVLDAGRRTVAEVRRKEAVKGGVCFGDEVFLLVVLPGFDSALAMALLLLLDQMFS